MQQMDWLGSEAPERGLEIAAVADSGRLAAVLRQHAKLAGKVEKKRRELERLQNEAREVRGQLAGQVGPLLEQRQGLDDEIHALFETLLAGKRLSRRANRDVREVYRELQVLGTISPRALAEEFNGFAGEWDGAGEVDELGADGPPGAGGAAQADVPDVEHRGRAADNGGLRRLFLKLAGVLHPDTVQDADEKRRRTVLMQELNRAYHDGDVARILEIEAAAPASGEAPVVASEDEIERRCRILSGQVELLSRQHGELLRELRETRRSELGEIVVEVRRRRRERAADPYRPFVEPVAQAIDVMRHVRDFVVAFECGEMELEDFLVGPQLASGDSPDDELDDVFDGPCDCPACTGEDPLEMFAELISELARAARDRPAQKSRAGAGERNKRGKRNKPRKRSKPRKRNKPRKR